MCANCGLPSAPGHWTEAGAATAHERLRSRFRRAELLRAVLCPYGLTAHDDGVTPGITVSSHSGHHEMVSDLAEVWATVERMTGRKVDPLDPHFIGREGEAPQG